MKPQSSPAPRCYILDEEFKVKLAVRSSADDPLNSLYTSDCPADALPRPVEQIVRQLTADWKDIRGAKPASAALESLIISVTPLHGAGGRHIGVFVREMAA
ncbi:MAG: hypothetical protein ABR584_06460 [Candidatus Baltobacteraceae bacterium]